MKCLITIAIIFSAQILCAQTGFDEAQDLFRKAKFSEAKSLFEKASETFHESQELDKYAICNLRIAECHLSMGEPKYALVVAQSTQSFLNSLLPENNILQAQTLNIIGNSYLTIGRNDLAIEKLQKASALFEDKSIEAASCFEDLGIAYWNNGNRALALQYHERCLDIRKTNGAEDILVGDSYINIGLVYLEDEPRQGILYFNRALEIYKSELSNKHPKIAYGFSDLAFANAHLGNYDEALNYLDQVENIWESSFSGDHPNKAFTESNRGRILEMKGDLDQALVFQQEALKMYSRINGEKHPDVANTYFLIGSIYQKKSEFMLAAEYYQQSIYANLLDQDSETVYSYPEVRDYFNADILLSSFQAKAKSLEAEHFEKSLKLRDIDGALNLYSLCDVLISQIRQLRHNEVDKLRLGEIASDVYENGIKLSLYLSERSFKKDDYLELAFSFCEKSKSAILLEAINETNAKAFGGVPSKELELEDSLKNEISYYKLELARSKSQKEQVAIKKMLFKYQSANRDFVQRLENEYPEYFNLKYSQNLATSSEIQEKLNDGTAVYSYFTGKEDLFIFEISNNKGLKVHSNEKLQDFEKQIKGMRNAMKYQLDEDYENASQKLFKQLIPKKQKGIDKLVIIPDGILGTIPFEVLATSPDKYGETRMLIEDYKVSYDYSGTLLLDRIGLTSHASIKGILLTAPMKFDKNDVALSDLPGTYNEVREIKYLFESDELKVEIATGKEASESLMKSDHISNYQYLHFATHGMVNQSEPDMSRIFLTPDDNEDGSLFAGEIYNIEINADLVTLSACETGLGKIAKGEGVVGLSRALMYAGAENIIVSLWPVADESTAKLMIEFYKYHLIHSENNLFSDDLRKAKIRMIRSEEYSQPYYWAPFILVGI
ncbi:MAG: CHAT domain-containing protein [Reichenbachiella sp.]